MRAFGTIILILAAMGAAAQTPPPLPFPIYNVVSYGANGNDDSDDTLAIRAAAVALQTAAEAAEPYNLGATLYFPPGRYRIFSTGVSPTSNNLAVFANLNGIKVIAEGATLEIMRQFDVSETGIIFGFSYCSNVVVDGFTVTGPNAQVGVHNGLNFVLLSEGNRNVSMPNNKLKGVYSGLTCIRANLTVPKSEGIVVGSLDVSNSVYGVTDPKGCDGLTIHSLIVKDVTRSYTAYGVRDHDVNITSYGAAADDVALGTGEGLGLENIRVRYTSPAEYTVTTPGSGEHARVRLGWSGATAPIRNIDIRLNVTYGQSTTGGPAFRLLKYDSNPAKLDNLRISGYVYGQPNVSIGDTLGPIIGTDESRNYWSTSDDLRNITMADLRLENSKQSKWILPGLKGPFLIQNVVSDRAIKLTEPYTGQSDNLPKNGRFTVINSMFPNLNAYYTPDTAQPLELINAAGSINVPLGWQGHVLSNEYAGTYLTYTLPAAVPGLEYGFARIHPTNFFYVRPQGTDAIRGGSAGFPALRFLGVGANAKLRCVTAGIWEIVESNGTFDWQP
ncbi:MAG TPA: glycosyl hydrolase family 28-related protein [Thermoanaerobaculia bacterium]|nr:glycosyl hydrolase family 28-related protein [Thermoanaerobaculia bacterium]